MSEREEDPTNEHISECINDMLHRIETLEARVERLPCDHLGFPIDEGYELDENDWEVQVNICRNCGEKV